MRFFRALECCINRDFEVTNIVECIKDAEYANTMLGCLLNELLYHVVGVVVIAEQVLTAEKHLNWRLEVFLQDIQALPRILIKEAQAAIKRSTPPCFK